MTRWVFNEDGWTDWIDHDGKGCPCVGWWAEVEDNLGEIVQGLAGAGVNSWLWYFDGKTYHCFHDPIIRYRVRKPKGAEMLEQLVQHTDMPIKEMV
ncbi:hypothetical protein [Phaeobacter italicus]|jgi:hypothetical protein|uniref:hypothetical protein n=1 Tax=Phaeobacter italicus TaxID=481446 RepID=UPI002FDE8551